MILTDLTALQDQDNPGWEVQSVEPGEVAFLSALMIAWPPDFGVVNFYPSRYPIRLRLPESTALNDVDVWAWVQKAMNELPYNRLAGLFGGSESANIRDDRFTAEIKFEYEDYTRLLYDRTKMQSVVFFRGMYHMIKANMLKAHHEFTDSAALELYVAMASTWELFAEQLREEGLSQPSNMDVLDRFEKTFGVQLSTRQYFGDYYTDRVRCLHPVARGEAAISPPIGTDDVYMLYEDLVRVFEYFLVGRPEEHFARYAFNWRTQTPHQQDALRRYLSLVPAGTYSGPSSI